MPGALGTALATQTVKAQVEASVGIHLHVCHVLLAEALHKVYDEPFQVSSQAVQADLLDPQATTTFEDRTTERRNSTPSSRVRMSPLERVSLDRKHSTLERPESAADELASDDGPPSYNAYIKPMFKRFRVVHMNIASEGVAGLAALISSCVPALADEIERHPDLTEKTHPEADLGRVVDLNRKPSKPALSRRPSRMGSTSGHQSETSSTSPRPTHAEVSFNTASLVDVGIDNTHPVTQAFTSEIFKYQAFFEQRLSAVADLQRQIMNAILDAMRKANEYKETEEDAEEARKAGLPNYSKILAASIKRNVKQQRDYMDCFFSSLGSVSFPDLDSVRSDISHPTSPRRRSSPAALTFDPSEARRRASSMRAHRDDRRHPSSPPASEESARDGVNTLTSHDDEHGTPKLATEIPIEITADIITREKPQMELLLFGFTEFGLRNQHDLFKALSSKLPVAKNIVIHPKLRVSSVFKKKLQRATLGTQYLDKFYKRSLTRYAAHLAKIVSQYVCVRAEMRKKDMEFATLVGSARDDTLKLISRMSTPPKARLTVIPAETDDEDSDANTSLVSEGDDDLNGRHDAYSTRATGRKRFVNLRKKAMRFERENATSSENN